MKVFKVCMLVLKRHIAAVFLYIFVFTMLCTALTSMDAKMSVQRTFEGYKPNISVINRDGDTALTKGLTEYLKDYAIEVPIEDSPDAIKDASFYKATDYILIIPQGFSDYILNGGEKVEAEIIITPDSARGYLLDEVVNKFFSTVENYCSYEVCNNSEDAVNMAVKDINKKADFGLIKLSDYEPVGDVFKSYMRMFGFFIMVVITLCVSIVSMSFEKTEMRMRNYSAPTRPGSVYLQQILYAVIISVVVWAVMISFGLIMFGKTLSGVNPAVLGLLLVNSFIFMLFAMSLAMVLSSFISSGGMMNIVANISALIFSFLGGIFVPLEIFNESLLNVVKLFPTYWYCSAMNSISALITFDETSLKPILTAFGLQLLFALAAFMVAMALKTIGTGSEKAYGNKQTQMAS